MGQYTSYYLYQKYEKRGNQDWVPVYPNVFSVDADGTKLKNIKSENDTNCGYVPEYDPIYRWAVAPGYICDVCPSSTATTTYCKYQKEVYQVSYDNGVTYSNVTPESARTGSLIEANSIDCGYSFIERWINSGTTCDGYDKYYLQVKQISEDGGSTWITTDVTRTGSLIERNSTDCGFSYNEQPFTVVPRGTNITVTFNDNSFREYSIKISKDSGETWTTITQNSYASVNVNSNEKLMVKINDAGNGMFGRLSVSGGTYDVEGNIMSLLYENDYPSATTINTTALNNLFRSSGNLISAENLVFPATTLSQDCYYGMFTSCSGLTTAPMALPATTLAKRCYNSMFMACTSLTTAPQLPATTLADECYRSMFWNCRSLTTAPELPATTLADGCYQGMFWGCTNITTAPVLSAATLVEECYYNMFYGCSSLNYIKCLATNISATDCTNSWVPYVSSTGTFVKASNMNDWTRGYSGIPSNWTIQDA